MVRGVGALRATAPSLRQERGTRGARDKHGGYEAVCHGVWELSACSKLMPSSGLNERTRFPEHDASGAHVRRLMFGGSWMMRGADSQELN